MQTITAPSDADGAVGSSVGRPIDRVDGSVKTVGAARYAAEAPIRGCAHATIVGSAIAKGRIVTIDAAAEMRLHGVIAVLPPSTSPTSRRRRPTSPAAASRPSGGCR